MCSGTYIWLDDKTVEYAPKDQDSRFLKHWLIYMGIVLITAVACMIVQ